MDEIKIEKNIPLRTRRTHTALYAVIEQMEIGDSFFIADGQTKPQSTGIARLFKKLGAKAAIRTVEGGMRVWRIA